MGDYVPLGIAKYASNSSLKTAESKYWRSFKNPILVNHLSTINHISFNPFNPNIYAIATSARVILYKNNSIKKTISRFKDTVYSAEFRNDGKILCGADATGLIQLFDVDSRSILRSLRGHQSAVRVAKFSSNLNIYSASDDKTVRFWDIPTETALSVFNGHEDYIRSGVVSTENPHLFLSGSYDHKIKLWDSRTPNQSPLTMNHNAPVESVLMLGSGLALSAGGNQVKIWDILGNTSQPMQVLTSHQKTVTCMCFDGSGKRILTGSLDHHVKVFGVDDFKVLHSVKYPAPILAIGLSPDDTRLVVGMSSGLVSIRQRHIKTSDLVSENSKKEILKTGTYKYFMRGSGHKPEENVDIWIESKKKVMLKKYDKFLRKFQFSKALDSVLNLKQNPVVVVSLIQELMHRNALTIALGNRDDLSLAPIANFLKKNISNPKFSNILIDLTNTILDMYSVVINQSPLIDEIFTRIKEKIDEEVENQLKMFDVIGMMDCLLNISIK